MENMEDIEYVVSSLAKKFSPCRIYVFSVKKSENTGEITDFDVCVISGFSGFEGKEQAMKSAYTEIDSPIPFDLFLYTPEEFEEKLCIESSFASRVIRKGKCVYES